MPNLIATLRKHGKLLSLLLLALLLVYFALNVPWADTIAALAEANFTLLAAACLIELFSLTLKSLRWKILLSELNGNISLANVFKIQAAGITASFITPARVGEAIKAFYLERWQLKKRETLVSVAWEHVLDLIVLFVIAATVLAAGQPAALAIIAAGIIILAVVIHNLSAVFSWLSRFKFLSALSQFTLHKFSKRTIGTALLITAVAWLVELTAVTLAFNSVGVALTYQQIGPHYAASVLVGVVSTIPGGLGSLEAALYLLLQSTGYTVAQLAAAFIAARVVTLGVIGAAGLASMAMLEKGKK